MKRLVKAEDRYCKNGYEIVNSNGMWYVWKDNKCYGSFSTEQDAEQYIEENL